ncbi:hypothetical protein [Urbifossiella limnaea]|uniref:Uncharacterized protein n=1 Tax=Urbifossiella limnaea TaxID=2528023 RepID=A0A517XXD3_9BACT|nr:hypothetical protein [Urbifossiella limnaea]QDU22179.1 hypothetical protein ETAA1_41550 [Urbifossiella limnaea]
MEHRGELGWRLGPGSGRARHPARPGVPGHPTPDNSYFRSDYSLTIQDPATTGTIGIVGGRGTDFVKLGAGHLILPQANPYFGRTLIEQGWVTVQNNRSLGDVVPATALGKTAQQPTIVSAGASLHLALTAPGVVLTLAEEHIVLEGLGLGSLPGQEQHPYSFINQKGALINLGGDNIITGDVGLISTGIGTATCSRGPARAAARG